jgi:hypothetical protein
MPLSCRDRYEYQDNISRKLDGIIITSADMLFAVILDLENILKNTAPSLNNTEIDLIRSSFCEPELYVLPNNQNEYLEIIKTEINNKIRFLQDQAQKNLASFLKLQRQKLQEHQEKLQNIENNYAHQRLEKDNNKHAITLAARIRLEEEANEDASLALNLTQEINSLLEDTALEMQQYTINFLTTIAKNQHPLYKVKHIRMAQAIPHILAFLQLPWPKTIEAQDIVDDIIVISLECLENIAFHDQDSHTQIAGCKSTKSNSSGIEILIEYLVLGQDNEPSNFIVPTLNILEIIMENWTINQNAFAAAQGLENLNELLALHVNTHQNIIINTTKTLYAAINNNSDNQKKFCKLQGVDSLICLLYAKNSEIRSHTTETLLTLAKNNIRYFYNYQKISALCLLLDDDLYEPTFHALEIIKLVSTQKKAQDHMRNIQGIDKIVAIFCEEYDNEEIYILASQALEALAFNNKQNQDYIAEKKGILNFLVILLEYSDNNKKPRIIENILFAMVSIAHNNPANIKYIGDDIDMSFLVKFLQHKEPGILYQIIRLLAVLVYNSSERLSLMRQYQGLNYLDALLAHNTNNSGKLVLQKLAQDIQQDPVRDEIRAFVNLSASAACFFQPKYANNVGVKQDDVLQIEHDVLK